MPCIAAASLAQALPMLKPWLPALLGVLSAIGPLSTDMYLPGFPAIEAGFAAPAGSAQVTLSAWFVGLALGQLAQGTLADRLGRRAPLLGGTALYIVASVACALAPGIGALSLARIAAALGASASMVVPRAIVRDLAEGATAARLMGQLMLVMGVAPILAPTLGGLLLDFGGWRGIFWVCVVYGMVNLGLVWRFLPDTLAPAHRVRLGLSGLLARFGLILRERAFLANGAIGSLTTFGVFAYVGGSPPVYVETYGLSPIGYGLIFGVCAGGFIAATQVNARIAYRIGLDRLTRLAAWAYAVAALVLCAVAWTGRPSLPLLVASVFCALFANGFLGPNVTIGALSRHAARAGSASALLGTIQFCFGALSGLVVGWLTDGTPRGFATLMAISGIGIVVADAKRPRPL